MKVHNISQEGQQKKDNMQNKLTELRIKLVPNYPNLNGIVQAQVDEVLNILLSKKDKTIIQAISKSSVLDQSPSLRSLIWKLQLQTLPLNPDKWSQNIQGNHQFYHHLVHKLFPKKIKTQFYIDTVKNEKFDEQLWSEIMLDIKRTHTALNFFKTNIQFESMYYNAPTKHSDLLGRILYIWGKVNPRIRYVQGMNEMIAPFYFLEFQNPNQYSQSQVFFMFSALMTFAMDMHMKQLDDEDHGIIGRVETLNKYLKVVDYQIWKKLSVQSILPEHYAFRWLALLFGQQFQLHDTIMLWDAVLSFDGSRRFFFLYCVCLSIIKLRKQHILSHDMIGILPKLQKIRDLDIDQILDLSFKLYEKYSKINIDKLCQRMQEQFKNRQKQLVQKNNNKTVTRFATKSSWNYTQLFKSTSSFLTDKIKDLAKQ